MSRFRMLIGALAFAITFALLAAPASSQGRQEGLVNVYADDVTVQAPVAVAANVCGVAVNVLSQAGNLGDVDCTAEGVAVAEDDNGGGGPVNQNGLVNVALVDVTVQVPVAVAANVCGVAVNVLATNLNAGSVDCDALATSSGQ